MKFILRQSNLCTNSTQRNSAAAAPLLCQRGPPSSCSAAMTAQDKDGRPQMASVSGQ